MIDMSHYMNWAVRQQPEWYSKYLDLWIEEHKKEMLKTFVTNQNFDIEEELSIGTDWGEINPITTDRRTKVVDGLRVKVVSFDEGVSQNDKNDVMSFDELMGFEGQ